MANTKPLIIVDSPTKAKTIGRFLSNEYVVESSFGHIRDLPKSKLGVDVENKYQPSYIIPVKAKYLVTAYAAFELYNGFFTNDNVAHFAHLGGLVMGIIIMLVWKRNKNFFF